jgi:hypothetical protein
VPAALMYYFNKKIETNPDTKRREKALERFWTATPDPIFENGAKTFMWRYPKSDDPRYQHLRKK